MKANRLPVLLGAVAFLAIFVGKSALANQMNINGPSSGTVTYTSNGDGSTLSLSWTAGLSDGATFVLTGGTIQDVGSYSFGAESGITLTNGGGGVFNVTSQPTAGDSFTYTSSNDSDTMSGTIYWTYVTDGSPTPTLHGTLLITSVSGDATFTNPGTGFPLGETTPIDFNISGSCSVSPCTLNNLVTTASGTMSGPISAGQIVDAAEPGSTLLLSVTLLVGGLFLRTSALSKNDPPLLV